jgi:hypothetical protein
VIKDNGIELTNKILMYNADDIKQEEMIEELIECVTNQNHTT